MNWIKEHRVSMSIAGVLSVLGAAVLGYFLRESRMREEKKLPARILHFGRRAA